MSTVVVLPARFVNGAATITARMTESGICTRCNTGKHPR